MKKFIFLLVCFFVIQSLEIRAEISLKNELLGIWQLDQHSSDCGETWESANRDNRLFYIFTDKILMKKTTAVNKFGKATDTETTTFLIKSVLEKREKNKLFYTVEVNYPPKVIEEAGEYGNDFILYRENNTLFLQVISKENKKETFRMLLIRVFK